MEQFHHLHNLNIHSSCRTCLESLNDMHHDIFAIPDFQEKFTICTQLPVEPGDGLPTSLCETCHAKIDEFYSFKQMCILATKRFQEFISSEQKPTAFELAMDPNDIQTHSMMFKKESNGELEDAVEPNDGTRLEFSLPDIKIQDDSSSQNDEEDSEEDHLSIKHSVTDEENEDEDYISEVKTRGRRKAKKPADSTVDLECKICSKVFKKPETYTAHMRVHDGLKPFPCHLCDASYARRSRLKGHIKAKHEGKPPDRYPCTEAGCERTFSCKQSYRNHIKDFHHGPGSKGKQLYICEECGKVLTSLATLKNHRYLHTGQQLPHECPECKKRYITKHKLKEHMNRHAGIRKFTCPHCGAKKSTRTELKTHINYHTKEKTYPCQFCDMVFNSIGNFSRHKRIVHEGIKDYSCSYCDKSFGKAETRKHHEMTHTGEKPHECDVCHKKFIQTVALKKHRKIHFKGLPNGEWEKE